MVIEAESLTQQAFTNLKFQYPLRRYQEEILGLARLKLERGERELHIVAPPGAGKTIIGLQMITEFKRPSVVICPNTTIQAQWGQKLELFLPPELKGASVREFIGTHEDRPLKPITLITYQVLSTPGREQEYLDNLARVSWLKELSGGLSLSAGAAELRILELMQNNIAAYRKEMSRHVSRLRRKLTEVLDLTEVLHPNALDLLQALRRQGFGLIIFDECHHLTDYWAAVMTHLAKRLYGPNTEPVIVGLTGTPPEGKSQSQETRYLSLVGEIDYQVPTPALVKEGGLAPFQDLVYFTHPTGSEMNFLTTQHEDFHLLLEELSGPMISAKSPQRPEAAQGDHESIVSEHSPLTNWILLRIKQHLKTGWSQFSEKHKDYALAMGRYLFKARLAFPRGMELTEGMFQCPLLDDWMLVLEDYALTCLKLSANSDDHKLYDRIKTAIRKLGYGLTEQGIRRQASPADRILAYSQSKPQAVNLILDTEHQNLKDRLRAVVVTDFERMAATGVRVLKDVLDSESGGAIAMLRELLSHPVSQYLNPCLVTGSLLLVDSRIGHQFIEAARDYISKEGFTFDLTLIPDEGSGASLITATSSDWETRLYVGMATQLFERGITKCLIGTRGIFGEGWDAVSLNTLIDLTTTTSPVSVKQLRGRSIRINSNDPLNRRKVANNWDIVCIAPELEQGLNDYRRFVRRHAGYFGISDDGQIECGVGHVHPAFSELTPAEVFAGFDDFNQEMLKRAVVRDQIYDLWKVGEPYLNRELSCVEVTALRSLALTPPFIARNLDYKTHVSQLRAALNGVWMEYGALGITASALTACLSLLWGFSLLTGSIPIVLSLVLAQRKHRALWERIKIEVCRPNTQESSLTDIATAILSSLKQVKLLPKMITADAIRINRRSGDSWRVFLDGVEREHSEYFAQCFQEVMEPISNQAYLIPKYEFSFPRAQDDASREKAFFRAYLKGRAEPRIACYHAVPKLLGRSESGRQAFQSAWNKYVSPGLLVSTEDKPQLLERYFGMGPSLARRLVWE